MLAHLFAVAGPDTEVPQATIEEAARVASLKEALVCEAHTAALMTATLTSGINALTGRTIRMSPAELAAFAPGEASRLATLARLLLDSDPALDDLIFTDELAAALGPGNGLLEAYLREAEAIGAPRAAVLHRVGLAEAWRQICHLAILAVRELDAHIAPDLPEIYVQNARVLTALLSGAKNGWRPCIDRTGRLNLPPLPQQRRWPRRALLQTCMVETREGKAEAFARDISAGGIGLDRMPRVSRGEIIVVELVSGRRLTGIVAWSSGATVGVRFPVELRPTDPLLVV